MIEKALTYKNEKAHLILVNVKSVILPLPPSLNKLAKLQNLNQIEVGRGRGIDKRQMKNEKRL